MKSRTVRYSAKCVTKINICELQMTHLMATNCAGSLKLSDVMRNLDVSTHPINTNKNVMLVFPYDVLEIFLSGILLASIIIVLAILEHGIHDKIKWIHYIPFTIDIHSMFSFAFWYYYILLVYFMRLFRGRCLLSLYALFFMVLGSESFDYSCHWNVFVSFILLKNLSFTKVYPLLYL